MTQLILHHYPNSPFAEKTRLMLGYKQLAWHSVLIPSIMPKPDLMPLTGGYRRTPVLQIGADVYCDTALIAEVLEQLAPTPTLFPAAHEGATRTLAQWADTTLFWTAIPYTMQPAGMAHMFKDLPPEAIKAFVEDRSAFRPAPRMRPAEAQLALSVYLERLENMLGTQDFFFGGQASIADFSIYHCLWFVARGGPVAAILARHGHLAQWRERVQAIGHGQAERMSSTAALAVARACEPLAESQLTLDTHGIALGERVIVAATDYGTDPVQGTLYGANAQRLSILREDDQVGRVVVHVPRLGFELRLAK